MEEMEKQEEYLVQKGPRGVGILKYGSVRPRDIFIPEAKKDGIRKYYKRD